MKFPLSGLMITLFLISFILLFSGFLHYWNPNITTLSGIFGNYNHKIYFFFLIAFLGCLCGLVYECTFNDIISLCLYFSIALSLLLLIWISEDNTGTMRNKTHVIFACISFSCVLLYILYNAIRRKDKIMYLLLPIGVFLFGKIIKDVLSYYNDLNNYPNLVFEEMSLVMLFLLAFVRRGDYL